MTQQEVAAMFPRASRSTIEANTGFAFQPEIQPAKAAQLRLPKPRMTKTEAEFGCILEARKSRGEIIEYAFEPFSLRYGADAFYKPDWVARTAGEVTIAALAKLCALHVIDIFSDPGLLSDYQSLIDSNVFKNFTIFEVKGSYIFPQAVPRWKAAKLRHGWADWEMWQKKKSEWARIL